jgi:glycosyltransferase involved in cell wall biosynthesis
VGLRLVITYGREAPLDPTRALEGPLSGIRAAALALSVAFARRGHDVHFFSPSARPGRHDGVAFHDRAEFATMADRFDADVLIAIPEILPLLMPLRARARVVWTGNAFATGDSVLAARWDWAPEIGRAGRTARLYSMGLLDSSIDAYVVKSRWQADYVSRSLSIAPEKFLVAFNGVPLEYYGGPSPPRHRHRLVYASQARRGLDVLLQLFPKIRAAVPSAELHVFGYEYDAPARPPDLPGASQAGVHWRGALPKARLAQELRAAAIMAYPCRFKETFCTAVAEAQAAGLPVVTSNRAGLSERVSSEIDGFLLAGDAEDPSYRTAFVDAVVRLLRDDELWIQMGRSAQEKAFRVYDWERIALTWEQYLYQLTAGRLSAPPQLHPKLDFLDPSLLVVRDRGRSAAVPAPLAEVWLRSAWAAYGYEGSAAPGLPTGVASN